MQRHPPGILVHVGRREASEVKAGPAQGRDDGLLLAHALPPCDSSPAVRRVSRVRRVRLWGRLALWVGQTAGLTPDDLQFTDIPGVLRHCARDAQRAVPWHVKKINLLVASYLFYAAWNPPFVILLWVSTVVDWWAAQWMVRAKTERTRKMWMLTSVVVNLGMLGYFKYGGFLMENFVELAGSFGVIYQPPKWDIVLPVGISFYTFATLSYTLDVYLRRSKPAGSFLNYALFVTFFPHLVAGPIMRPTELVPQFESRAARPPTRCSSASRC